MSSHLLSLVLLTPLLGALVIGFLPRDSVKLIRSTAMTATLATAGLVAMVFFSFQSSEPGYQMMESIAWIPQLHVYYLIGIDGISLPLVILTVLISLLACKTSTVIREREKEYYILFLLLEAGMLGTFLALDLFLFYVFWEVALVPLYFLIGIWGGPRRKYAAIKFFLYTLAGSLFMLLGIIAVYLASGQHTFNLMELSRETFSHKFQMIAFFALFIGFAIKVPIWPFHTWLPDAHVEAPTPISVILAGVLLKMGTYGLLRFNYSLFPEAARTFQPALVILAVIGIIYGGFVALAQTDFKKMVAYSSISHMGFVLMGLAAMNQEGFNGAVLHMFNHGVITGGLFILIGMLYARTQSRNMNNFGGLMTQMPVYAGITVFFSMASLGLPGLSGFTGEFLSLFGIYQYSRSAAGLASLGLMLTAVCFILMIRNIFLGPTNIKWEKIQDISKREISSVLPLMVFIVVVGVAPNLVLHYIAPSLAAALQHLGAVIS